MSEMDEKSSAPSEMMGGAKRKNGHKSTCSCHICENMKNKARRGGYRADAQKAALKKMLEADQLRIVYTNLAGQVVQLTF